MVKAKATTKSESTYAELQKQIEDLTAKAQAVREQEIRGVIERIREAIAVYELTADQLFGNRSVPKAKSKSTSANEEKKGRATKAKASEGIKAAPKFRDPQSGKTWTGNGKRPGWFVAAVEAGVDLQTLAA